MNRREFLVRVSGTLVAVPIVIEAVGCGSDDDPAAPTGTDEFSSPSTNVAGHTHEVTLQCSSLTMQGDLTLESTPTGAHTHRITLTAAQLQQIAAGNVVGPVTSTIDNGHTHDWTLQKPSNSC
jgi:hypothetical protein